MENRYYKAESRVDWSRQCNGVLTLEELKLGAILRIADAVEKMVRPYTELLNEIARFKVNDERMKVMIARLERSNASLRGHLRRAKGK